jgi:hypothetical protein
MLQGNSASIILNNTTNNDDPKRLAGNYTVSVQRSFTGSNKELLAANNSSAPGNFLDQTGFIGVRFSISSSYHYGWIQYKTNSDATVGTIIDWAYEDSPGTPIKTGDSGNNFSWNLFLPAIINGNKP